MQCDRSYLCKWDVIDACSKVRSKGRKLTLSFLVWRNIGGDNRSRGVKNRDTLRRSKSAVDKMRQHSICARESVVKKETSACRSEAQFFSEPQRRHLIAR